MTLPEIEAELLDIADDDLWRVRERLLALTRRIAVQIETDKLKAAAA